MRAEVESDYGTAPRPRPTSRVASGGQIDLESGAVDASEDDQAEWARQEQQVRFAKSGVV